MPRHEYFEELCAAASIGQASGAELAQLKEHLAICSECRESYSDFVQINSAHYATHATSPKLSYDDAVGSIDSALLRERFLKKAQAQGIVFLSKNSEVKLPEPETRRPAVWQFPGKLGYASAAALLIIAIISVGYRAKVQQEADSSAAVAAAPANSPPSLAPNSDAQSQQSILAALEDQNRILTAEIAGMKDSVAKKEKQLAEAKTAGANSEQQRLSLISEIKQRDVAIADLQKRLELTQASAAKLHDDLQQVQAGTAADQAALIEARIKLQELSAELADKASALERERELLAAGRDIRELMAARNLHIVDVFDTDPKGKTRPSFGRIFLTEGKSLLFYAYDLSDRRVEEAGYHYRIWGKKEGPNQRARNLGIFYSDNKSQKRWVFQYDDPKVLHEIDSVFVTLEPPDGKSNQPRGEKLMYAYLRGQANHP